MGRCLGAPAVVETELVLADFVELDSVECKYTSLDTTVIQLHLQVEIPERQIRS